MSAAGVPSDDDTAVHDGLDRYESERFERGRDYRCLGLGHKVIPVFPESEKLHAVLIYPACTDCVPEAIQVRLFVCSCQPQAEFRMPFGIKYKGVYQVIAAFRRYEESNIKEISFFPGNVPWGLTLVETPVGDNEVLAGIGAAEEPANVFRNCNGVALWEPVPHEVPVAGHNVYAYILPEIFAQVPYMRDPGLA